MNSCMNKVLIWDDCRLYEEAAEGLHQLSDKLPPPGKALLDVIFLGFAEEAPKLKDFLPVIGSLKHMQTWHSAKMTIVTEHQAGWQKPASNLSARVVDPSSIMTCIDERELWRGGVLIREKKALLGPETGVKGHCKSTAPWLAHWTTARVTNLFTQPPDWHTGGHENLLFLALNPNPSLHRCFHDSTVIDCRSSVLVLLVLNES
eukprot:XP_014039975.1 PREDICTED: mdm2-binding protein-like [Salmo salar]